MTRRIVLDGPTATTGWHYTVRAGNGMEILARTSLGVTLGTPSDHIYADVEIASTGELLVTWDDGTESVTERIAPSGPHKTVNMKTLEVRHG